MLLCELGVKRLFLLLSLLHSIPHKPTNEEGNIMLTTSDISSSWESPWSHMAHIKSIFMSPASNSKVQNF